MREQRARFDRRTEERYPLGGRISWRPAGDTINHPGWLCDTSMTSVSFITPERQEPVPNDQIELSGQGCSRLCCRVTRVASYGGRMSLVGCQSAIEDVACAGFCDTEQPIRSGRRVGRESRSSRSTL